MSTALFSFILLTGIHFAPAFLPLGYSPLGFIVYLITKPPPFAPRFEERF